MYPGPADVEDGVHVCCTSRCSENFGVLASFRCRNGLSAPHPTHLLALLIPVEMFLVLGVRREVSKLMREAITFQRFSATHTKQRRRTAVVDGAEGRARKLFFNAQGVDSSEGPILVNVLHREAHEFDAQSCEEEQY